MKLSKLIKLRCKVSKHTEMREGIEVVYKTLWLLVAKAWVVFGNNEGRSKGVIVRECYDGKRKLKA